MRAKIAVGIFTLISFTSLISYGIARHVVETTPVAPQVMIADVAQVLGDGKSMDIAANRRNAEERTQVLKQLVQAAADRGIVVIDADSVIKAPAEAYIKLPTELGKDKE